MEELSLLAEAISKGKHLDTNIEKYVRGISSMYSVLSYIKLSMNYYTMYDSLRDQQTPPLNYETHYDEFNNIVKELLSGQADIARIEAFRQDIISTMDVVVSFVDELRIYEHVLNRVEYRFKEASFDEDYYNSRLTNDCMHYILSDRDNVVINGKIASLVGQLPVRMTKARFFEHIRDAFTLYHGAQKGTIDDFAYSLRTTSLLDKPEGYKTAMPDTYKLIACFSDVRYSELDDTLYNQLSDKLKSAAASLNATTDFYVLLAQMVNDVYTIALTQAVVLPDSTEELLAKTIIGAVNEAELGKTEVDESILDSFVEFEGKQERILNAIAGSDYLISSATEDHAEVLEKLHMTGTFEMLKNVMKLQSGSDFVQLHADESYSEVPDDSYCDKVCQTLIDDLTESFEKHQMIVRRAIMATVLSQLPVFFNSTTEIQQYINTSLIQCQDRAEQTAVIEILRSIMEE